MKAYQVIDRPEKWTTGSYARDTAGSPVLATSPDAVCFCAIGALQLAYPFRPEFCAAYDKLEKSLVDYGALTIPFWNDTSDQPTAYRVLKELDI